MEPDSRFEVIREDPAGPVAAALLGEVIAELSGDLEVLTSTDVPRLRALARLLDDTAQLMVGARRAEAKATAAMCDRFAGFLASLGDLAREGFGDTGAW